MNMTLEILTFIMPNVTINEFFIQSPSLICAIEIHDNGCLVCNVTRYWVTKGSGTITLTFINHCDFRTAIQLDIASILTDTIDKLCEISQVKNATMYDNSQSLKNCDPSVFKEIWSLCNDGILIDDHIFRLSEFRVIMEIENITD